MGQEKGGDYGAKGAGTSAPLLLKHSGRYDRHGTLCKERSELLSGGRRCRG